MATKKKAQDEIKSIKPATPVVVDRKEEADTKAKVEVASKLTLDSVTRDLSKLDLTLTSTLRDIGSQLKVELAKLEAVKETIVVKEQELETLYGKDVAARALTELVAEYESQKVLLEKEIATKLEEFEKALTAKEFSIKEQELAVAKARKVEQEEYDYKKSILRRNDEDSWKKLLSDRDFAEKKRAADFEEQFSVKTKELLDKQAELEKREADLKLFDSNVKAQLTIELKNLEKMLTDKFSNELRFVKQDYESKLALEKATNANLLVQIENHKDTISHSTAQIAALSKQISEMAMGSISAVGNAQTIKDLKEVSKLNNNKQ